MQILIDYPFLMFVAAFLALWLASGAGRWLHRRKPRGVDSKSKDFDIVAAATLTLLALIIGFSFSMATSRYDKRKSLEASEANAIGTEYLRADLLPLAEAANVRTLLVAYLDQRMLFYANGGEIARARIRQRTDQLQARLWTELHGPAAAQPTPVMALVLAGMNDAINSRGYTEAAMLDRIPTDVWALMAAIALCSSLLLGYGSQSPRTWGGLGFVLPLVVSISLLLIADIDEPTHGLIHVRPENLQSLAQLLKSDDLRRTGTAPHAFG